MRLACWFCGRDLDPVDVIADATLEPRETELGGPLYRYRCRACKRENICERNIRGRLLARPRATVPIVDALQARLDPSIAEDDARRRAWWAKHEGVVAWFHDEYVRVIDEGLEGPAPEDGEEAAARDGPDGEEPRFSGGGAGTGAATATGADGPRDPYDVLGVPRGAPRGEVVAAFRRLAKEHHPDLFATRSREEQEAANRRFVEILDAYARLRETAAPAR